jgi:ribose/xylose/arabinose/galactoside ABC-type transport system permease subunit
MNEDVNIKELGNNNKNLMIFNIMSKFGVSIMILVLLIIGLIIYPRVFLTASNLIDVVEVGAILGIVSLGVTFVTLSGHFCDLSIPGIMASSGIVAVQVLPLGIFASIIGAMLTGMFLGFINGLVIGKFKANPIIWTLAMQFLISGLLRWAYSGNQIYPDVIVGGNLEVAEYFYGIYRTRLWDVIPLIIIVMLILAVICQFVLSKTQFGIHLRLTGSNLKVAKFSGVNTIKIIWIAFTIAGLFGGIGGLLLCSLSKLAAFNLGEGYDFSTLTAIVLGGVTLTGGRGNFFGVIGGVITLGLLGNVMTFIGLGTFEQLLVKGLVFIMIVLLNSYSLRKMGKDYV